MPKKGKQLEDFSGGVNTYADPQNIADNELAHASGFKSELGEIVVLGDMKAAYTIGSGDTAAFGNIDLEAGYGLFTFSSDYDIDGDLAATNYFALQNEGRIHIYDDTDHTWNPKVTGTTYAAVDTNPDTITDSSSGFVTAGFKQGMTILVSGSSESGNNTTHVIASVIAGTITLNSSSALTADGAGDTWTITGSQIDLGTVSSDAAFGSFKPCFVYVDNALRVSPGDFKKVDCGADTNGAESVSAVNRDLIGFISTISVDGYKAEAGDILVIGDVEYFLIFQRYPSSSLHIVVRNTTGMFISTASSGYSMYVMPDTKWRGIVQRRCFSNLTTVGTFSEWFTCPMAPKPPAIPLALSGLDGKELIHIPFHAELDIDDMVAANNLESGVLVVGTKNDTANADGAWDTTISFWMTALYDDVMQESQPLRIQNSSSGVKVETIAAGAELAVVINVQYSAAGTNYSINKRVVGGRLYYEDTVDEPGTLYQLLDIDFEKGCKKAESESFIQWVQRTANIEASCPATDGTGSSEGGVSDRTGTDAFIWAVPPKSFTYEINTGYPVTTNIHARFKTAVVANRRLYVGNVYQGGKAYGDRILYSPVNKFDILPETNSLPLAIGDGDEIVKLASFADRLLSFKKRTLYIINIGGGALSAFIESQHANMGVENPCQVCDTEYGTAWVNKFGVFLYDGQKVVELTRGKLQLSNSTRGLGLNIVESLSPLIGYHSLNKWVVVHVSSEVSGSYEAEAWIYDFKNGSWTWSQEFTADADFKTNMIATHDNELVFAAGTNSSNTPDFFKYRDTGVADPAQDKLFLLTKDFTLDMPSVGKDLKHVYITYESSGDSKMQVDFITTSASGVATVTGATSSDSLYHVTNGFQTTGGVKKTVKIKPSSSIKKVNSFQLKIDNDHDAYDSSACGFKLYNITFVYRDRSIR